MPTITPAGWRNFQQVETAAMTHDDEWHRDQILCLRNWYNRLVREDWDRDLSELIKEKIDSTSDPLKRELLGDILLQELKRTEKYDEARSVLERRIESNQNDVLPAVWLAELFLHFQNAPAAALMAIESALVRAERTKSFRRLALGVKARVALAMDRYDLLEHTLRSIIALGKGSGGPDAGIERDFFDRADRTRLPSDVVGQYLSLVESTNTSSAGF